MNAEHALSLLVSDSRLPSFERTVAATILAALESEQRDHDGCATIRRLFADAEAKERAAEAQEDANCSAKTAILVRYIAQQSIDLRFQLYSNIFDGEFTTDLVKKRVKDQLSERETLDGSTALTYGDIDFFSFSDIFLRSKPQKGEKFFDLGHGTGRAPIAAALLAGHALVSASGIEIVDLLYGLSTKAQARYAEEITSEKYAPYFAEHLAKCKVELHQGDFLSEEHIYCWTDADIIFINSTCFDDKLLSAIAEQAIHTKPGTRLITLTKSLMNCCKDATEAFEITYQNQYVMSWGTATVMLHVRR